MPIDFDLNSTFNEGTSIEEAAAESIRSLEKLIQLSTSYAAGFREIAEQTVSNCNKMISAIKRTGHARFRQGPVASIEQPKAPVVAPEPEKSLINKNIDFAMTKTEFRQFQDFNSKFGPEFLSTAGTFSKNLGSGILNTAGNGSVAENPSRVVPYTGRDGSVTGEVAHGILHTVIEGSVTGNQSSSISYAAGGGDGSVTGKKGPGILHTAFDGSVTENQSCSIIHAAVEGDGSVTGKFGTGFFFSPAVNGSIIENQSFSIFYPPGKASVTGNLDAGNLYTPADGSADTRNFASGNLLTAEAGPSSVVGEQGRKRPHSAKKMNGSASDKRAKLAGGKGGEPSSSRIADINQDEYSWRKYGEKDIKNASRRSYYRCSSFSNCPARKLVQCDLEDPSKLIITYKRQHDHS